MSIKNGLIISVLIANVFIFASVGIFIYKKQARLEAFLEQSQHEQVFQAGGMAQSTVIEKIMTSGQLWRPVQDRVRDTVIQIFAQVSAIDILEPYKTPQQGTACGS